MRINQTAPHPVVVIAPESTKVGKLVNGMTQRSRRAKGFSLDVSARRGFAAL